MKRLFSFTAALMLLCIVTNPAFSQDSDVDGVLDVTDNCIDVPNGPDLGICVRYVSGVNVGTGTTCNTTGDCATGQTCNLAQEDSNDNGIGDACECSGNFYNDTVIDLWDLVILKGEFAKTCPPSPCSCDLTGDSKVDLTELIILKFQYLRTDCP